MCFNFPGRGDKIEVIPGIEITTAEGDLLALFVTEKIELNLPLIETILKVEEAGGICIAPRPMARGMGMKSLNRIVIQQVMQHPEASRILLGIETYNATTLDRESSIHGQALAAEFPVLTQVGSSDAHTLETIGLGATEFLGYTAANVLDALWIGATEVRQRAQLGSARILGSWAINYVLSAPARAAVLEGQRDG